MEPYQPIEEYGTMSMEDPTSEKPRSTKLLDKDQPPKLSGKAWGRVSQFVRGKSDFPLSVFFIVGTEFCERFSYYGMKAILVLYMTNILLQPENTATALYHTFNMLCYFTPIFGAMIADGWLGKYRTILYISMIYMVGNIVMCLTALPPQTTGHPEIAGPMIGLVLIGLGTGGIKPCVSAFGGDQFTPDQEGPLQKFFSVFYFSINAGSLISTFMTPILRHDVQCWGNDCYALAFGVPAVLMFIAVTIFFLGRTVYKIYPSTGNIVWQVVETTAYAINNRCRHKHTDQKKAHWMDWAEDKYDPKLVTDIKDLYHILVMYLPLPIFWTLFDQQGSRWTLQAQHMDGSIGSWTIKPDQMQALNPVLIILFIPFFEVCVYPCLRHFNVPFRPLQRMTVGMLLAAVAFVLAGFIQLKIDSNEISLPGESRALVKVFNAAPCDIDVDSKFYTGPVPYANTTDYIDWAVGPYETTLKSSCEGIEGTTFNTKLERRKGGNAVDLFVYNKQNTLGVVQVTGQLTKPPKGLSSLSLGWFTDNPSLDTDNLTVVVAHSNRKYNFEIPQYNITEYQEVEPDTYNIFLLGSNITVGQFETEQGGIYRLLLQPTNDPNSQEMTLKYHTEVEPNRVSMFWQIPQYIIITAGEILFSITGLEFSYSQAPASMKSCVQAAWLMTVAIGNLVVIIVAEAKIVDSQALEFFLFAGLMTLIVIIFAIMSYFYVYITPQGYEEHDEHGLLPSGHKDEEEEVPPKTPDGDGAIAMEGSYQGGDIIDPNQ
ncbi:solute carrier family 15 member 2-like isoform X2 [Amphiura filiformis]|uniref:solute carrier family 15 member 2-like isoform X2 n=1 Tax=Amphiura filiformis TaxID=82378 RepID=UPI003B2200EE